jgi:hypothetical protein
MISPRVERGHFPSDDEAMSGGSDARFEWERLATDLLTRSVVKEGQFRRGNIEINLRQFQSSLPSCFLLSLHDFARGLSLSGRLPSG